MADTRDRPRVGSMQIMEKRPGPMYFDSWAVCPKPGCLNNERDGTAHYQPAAAEWRCHNGHRWDERNGLWEVQGR